MKKMNDFKSKYGPWALVTGASSGIGKEFARQLAQIGMGLVLAARRRERLDQNAQELEGKYGVKVKTVQVDLTDPDFLKTLEQATQGMEIGLLVNNAGAEIHGNFLEQDFEKNNWLVKLNIIAPMQLTHVFGRLMAARGRGGIIFTASTVAYQGTPFFANYSGTKAYILNFGEALNYEMRKKGIDVTVLSPGFTNTEMPTKMAQDMDFSNLPFKPMEVAPVVETALSGLGKRASVIPGGMNRFMGFIIKRLFTRAMSTKMFGSMMEKSFVNRKEK